MTLAETTHPKKPNQINSTQRDQQIRNDIQNGAQSGPVLPF